MTRLAPRRAAGFACLAAAPLLALSTVVAAAGPAPVPFDPPVDPPPCNVVHDPVFCFRATRFRRADVDPDRYTLEFEMLNWTGEDVHGLVVTLNTGGNNDPGAPPPPVIVGAGIDQDGRPINGAPSPPRGNQATNNDWAAGPVFNGTRVEFFSGTPIDHPTASAGGTTYHGLRDPAFAGASNPDCVVAILGMIPGSMVTGGSGNPGDPTRISIADPETVDDGRPAGPIGPWNNVLDGFLLEIDGLVSGARFSLNWFLLNQAGQPIGHIVAPLVGGGGVQGNPFGFGTLNFSILDVLEPPGTLAPPPIFTVNSTDPGRINTGFDPANNFDPNIDSARCFAEDSLGGLDTYPVNPIPAGLPGQGTYLHIEPGAAVTAPFRVPSDAQIGSVIAAVNFFEPGGGGPGAVPTLPEWGLLLLSLLLLGAGLRFVQRREAPSPC